jgi:hypothetical protein
MGVRYQARPGFELVTQVSGIKLDRLLTKTGSPLGEFARICNSIAQNVKLVQEAAQYNRWHCYTIFFQVMENGDT